MNFKDWLCSGKLIQLRFSALFEIQTRITITINNTSTYRINTVSLDNFKREHWYARSWLMLNLSLYNPPRSIKYCVIRKLRKMHVNEICTNDVILFIRDRF